MRIKCKDYDELRISFTRLLSDDPFDCSNKNTEMVGQFLIGPFRQRQNSQVDDEFFVDLPCSFNQLVGDISEELAGPFAAVDYVYRALNYGTETLFVHWYPLSEPFESEVRCPCGDPSFLSIDERWSEHHRERMIAHVEAMISAGRKVHPLFNVPDICLSHIAKEHLRLYRSLCLDIFVFRQFQEPPAFFSLEKPCRKCASPPAKLLLCSGCLGPQYCSPECQKADWPNHKKDCQMKIEPILTPFSLFPTLPPSFREAYQARVQ